MPASRHSAHLTELYRNRLRALAGQAEAAARRNWPSIQALDITNWPQRTAVVLTEIQIAGIRASAGYLGAFLASETGRRQATPVISSRDYAGLSRDGRPLSEALRSPIIGVLGRLKAGEDPLNALRFGLNRALRTVAFEAMQTPRDALIATIEADERFSGFQRSVSGTCAACEALQGQGGPHFEVHPGCECSPQPVVRGVRDRFPLITAAALFASKSTEQQDEAVGPEAAALIRDGKADLKDFIGHSRTEHGPDFITQRPVSDVAAA